MKPDRERPGAFPRCEHGAQRPGQPRFLRADFSHPQYIAHPDSPLPSRPHATTKLRINAHIYSMRPAGICRASYRPMQARKMRRRAGQRSPSMEQRPCRSINAPRSGETGRPGRGMRALDAQERLHGRGMRRRRCMAGGGKAMLRASQRATGVFLRMRCWPASPVPSPYSPIDQDTLLRMPLERARMRF